MHRGAVFWGAVVWGAVDWVAAAMEGETSVFSPSLRCPSGRFPRAGDWVSPEWGIALSPAYPFLLTSAGQGRVAVEGLQIRPGQQGRPGAQPLVHLAMAFAVEVQAVAAQPLGPVGIGQHTLQQG